jgi:hypothetical protein
VLFTPSINILDMWQFHLLNLTKYF